jgi:phosphopantetheinyl transferase (holo-ACP synthase)
MVGNDVVDLGDPEARAGGCHARFDARVFAASELALLAASAQPVRLRWTLWAAKEAVFKAARKHDPGTVFSPRRFVVRSTTPDRAEVAFGDASYDVDLQSDERYVHAVAVQQGGPARTVLAAVERLAHDSTVPAGEAVRALAIRTIAPRLGVATSELRVTRDGRIPRLEHGGRLATDLSLSHHGCFVAFACTLPDADPMRGAS